jgi:acyl CoA:acetate/3-ketoacid CoA transferase beta subunit
MNNENSLQFTAADQMVVSAARQVKNNDSIYVGVGLPMLAALLAKHNHAPKATIVIENGIIRVTPYDLPPGTDSLGIQAMSDQLTSLLYINTLGQAGYMTMGFMGGGQVDRYGNINDTVIGDYYKPVHRWPGSGGGNDVMSFCKRTVVILRQSKRRFPERVDFITCPGYFDGTPNRREKEGLPPGTGPVTVVTDLGIFGFNNGEMILVSYHEACGVTLEKVKAEVSWDLKISPQIKVTEPPTRTELQILHEKVDPQRLWSGGKRNMQGPQKENLD